ncbi:MAG: copper chaperone PCu(A)C [Alcanivorax sp.]|nr:copper chaperone PCu(A)C [Alcanivorax sp.]
MGKGMQIGVLAILLAGVVIGARAEVVVQQPWLRAVPPVSPTMAGYMVLVNRGRQAVRLTGARSEVAGQVVMHRVVMEKDGSSHMQALGTVTLAPGERLIFAPGGRHLMLMDMSRVPPLGSRVPVCLQFRKRAPLCQPFLVRQQAPVSH